MARIAPSNNVPTQQRALTALFVVLALAVLLVTPIAAGFDMRPFACDFGPSANWLKTIVNLKHLISYGVLAAVAFLAFRDRPILVPILTVLAVTAGVEVTQAIFNDGHCRAVDMIPNLIAISVGWALAGAAERLLRRRSRAQ